MRRSANNRSSIYLGGDGYWHGRVTVGLRDDGRPDRRHVMAKTQQEVTKKVAAVEKLRDLQAVPKVGTGSWTTERWLEHWLVELAKPHLRPNAWDAYRINVRKHIVPHLGKRKLAELRPEHLIRLYGVLIANGLSTTTAHRVHETLHVAFEAAVESGYMARNPATKRIAPKIRKHVVEPLREEEVQAILNTAQNDRAGVRWFISIALGLRQGELLALCWADLDLERNLLRVRHSRERPRYEHGCDPPCGKRHAGWCPQKRRLNSDRGATKSDASRRVIGLPAQLVDLLLAWKAEQDLERQRAANLWEEGDWVFTDRFGRPLNNNSEHYRWKDLLQRAGVREVRLHDARHTAATMLLLLGIPERAVIDTMGWSTSKMTAVYQHVTDPVRAEVARRVGDHLWRE